MSDIKANQEEYLIAKVALALFGNENSEWDNLRQILEQEEYESERESIIYDAIKFVVFTDSPISDMWYKYAYVVKARLKGLVSDEFIDGNEDKLKELLFVSNFKFDTVSMVARLCGFNDYAQRRFDNAKDKKDKIKKLTLEIASSKFLETILSNIEIQVDTETDRFIKEDIVNFKNNFIDNKNIDKGYVFSRGTDIKEIFKLRLEQKGIEVRNGIESHFVGNEFNTTDKKISSNLSEIYSRKSSTSLTVVSLIIDEMVKNR